MQIAEGLYYLFMFSFGGVMIYLLVVKTEALANRWVTWGVVAIIYIILEHLRGMVKKNGKPVY